MFNPCGRVINHHYTRGWAVYHVSPRGRVINHHYTRGWALTETEQISSKSDHNHIQNQKFMPRFSDNTSYQNKILNRLISFHMFEINRNTTFSFVHNKTFRFSYSLFLLNSETKCPKSAHVYTSHNRKYFLLYRIYAYAEQDIYFQNAETTYFLSECKNKTCYKTSERNFPEKQTCS